VGLEVVVTRDGTVGDIRVTKSFDGPGPRAAPGPSYVSYAVESSGSRLPGGSPYAPYGCPDFNPDGNRGDEMSFPNSRQRTSGRSAVPPARST
jgi:hypothetical protein